jgi:hypothetical protein
MLYSLSVCLNSYSTYNLATEFNTYLLYCAIHIFLYLSPLNYRLLDVINYDLLLFCIFHNLA